MDTGGHILLIDKPSGITSFDVIRQLRKKLGIKKIGHAGTLDPLASGLLIVGVSREGTKQLDSFLKKDKTYSVEIRIGESTDTGDIDGAVEEVHIPEHLDEDAVKDVLNGFIGECTLAVPRYAAIKQGGQPLYKRARAGEDFEPPKRVMKINDISFKGLSGGGSGCWILSVTMDVGSGAYVRSIAEAIGRTLGYPACVQMLRRTRIGEYTVERAKELDAI